MIKDYYRLTLRSLRRNKGYFTIDVFGLALGLACCLLIFVYVKDELTYDQYHQNADRIYRIATHVTIAGNKIHSGSSGYPEGLAYKNSIPEIEELVRMDNERAIVQLGDGYINQSGIVYSEESLFRVFDFELLDGSLVAALNQLNDVVITREMAIKYFGKADVAGTEMKIDLGSKLETFIVKAVIDDHPSNSSFNFKMALSWKKRVNQLNPQRLKSWSSIGISNYVLLTDGADVKSVEGKMWELRSRLNPGAEGQSARDIRNSLQNISDIHLNSEVGRGDGMTDSNDSAYSWTLSGIALIILILACMNFANLSIARSIPRTREIGVRKVLGASKKQLAFQFLNEAFLTSIIAFVLGLVLAEIMLPSFGELFNKKFTSGVFSDLSIILPCIILIAVTAILAGLYPSLVVSRFNSVNALKGKNGLRKNSYVTKGLITVQFTITAALITGTIAMNRQIDYMVDMDLGYDDENVVMIRTSGSGVDNLDRLFKDSLGAFSGVDLVAASDGFGPRTFFNYMGGQYESFFIEIDENYFDMMGLELLEGRKFRKGKDVFVTQNDTLSNVLVNESFVKRLEIDNPIGTIFRNYRIAGVFKDFYFNSTHGAIDPLILLDSDIGGANSFDRIYVKLSEGSSAGVESMLEGIWGKFVPFRPFESVYLEEWNAQRYSEEERWNNIIFSASGLAIVISLLGLFGLASLSALQRTKEIGIRKVLGSSVIRIILLLNTEFAKLVVLSILVSTPIAYYLLDNWLSGFENRISLTVFLFVIPGVITLSVALITVSIRSLRSAYSNPVDSLRYE